MTSLRLLQAITLAAGIGFILPLVAVLLAVLLLLGARRVAFCWALSLALSIAVTIALKAWLSSDPALEYFPSGHVTLAVTGYGGALLALSAGRSPARLRMVLVALLGITIGGVEGISRVALTDHTWLDVAGGTGIGTASLLFAGAWTWPPVAARRALLAAAAFAAALAIAVGPALDHAIRTVVRY